MKPGILIVQQVGGKKVYRRDFDAAEWQYEWVKRGECSILRLSQTGGTDGWMNRPDPGPLGTMEFAEFSQPVSITYEVFDE